ncbi:MAG: helicase-related protein, partial [Pseudonocardia sp.]
NARNRAIAAFAAGEPPVLVATDVAARGIHVDDVSLVVHVDPPADPKDYVHRAGRTARAGDIGTVVTMATPEQRSDVDALTRKAGVRATVTEVAPGGADLVRITGARAGGVPEAERPAHLTPPATRPTRSGRGAADPAARVGQPRQRSSDPTARAGQPRQGSADTAARVGQPRRGVRAATADAAGRPAARRSGSPGGAAAHSARAGGRSRRGRGRGSAA